MSKLHSFLHDMFSLEEDMADYETIHENIVKGASIKGTNFVILMMAIFVASIGLNMNSTAVIIGAMLISPLMGGIMAIGYGAATLDWDLAKKSAVILALEVLISLAVSTAYFAISPISTAYSELLARTSPTVWDVLIAFFGGFAGIIGSTRKEKGNVIPGVAIATALMPPLCTAGFGLANKSISYFLGAMYLFFINSFFIGLATYIALKLLHVPMKHFLDEKKRKRFKRNLIIWTLIVLTPSVYLGYQIVTDSLFDSNVNSYLSHAFHFDNTQVVQTNVDKSEKVLTVALIGNTIDADTIAQLEADMSKYGMSGWTLKVNQTQVSQGVSLEDVESLIDSSITSSSNSISLEQNTEILELNNQITNLRAQLLEYQAKDIDVVTMTRELSVLYPEVAACAAGYVSAVQAGSDQDESRLVVFLEATDTLPDEDISRIGEWVAARMSIDVAMVQVVQTAVQAEMPVDEHEGAVGDTMPNEQAAVPTENQEESSGDGENPAQ